MDANPTDEANEAQARLFLQALDEHVERCTVGIETTDARARALREKGDSTAARILDSESRALRDELYEVFRQIDRLAERFPSVRSR